jgi:hypothetical protein
MVDLLPVPNLLSPEGFHPISYCLRIPKTLIFAMLLATIPSFHGYYMKVVL